MVSPADRFAPAPSQSFQPVVFGQDEEDSMGLEEPHTRRLMRKVCEYGRIRLAGLSYQVGRFLADDTNRNSDVKRPRRSCGT